MLVKLQILASSKTTYQSYKCTETFNIPKQFICDQSSFEKFRNALKQDDVLLRISNFEKTNFASDCKGIYLATEQFTKIITDTCLRSLKVGCPKKKPKKYKLWFLIKTALLRKNPSMLSNLQQKS